MIPGLRPPRQPAGFRTLEDFGVVRDEHDREDLMREATALARRAEYVLPEGTAVVIGFRTRGGDSVYFGDEPAYHFNAAGELRRAFLDGQLLKAERGRLIALRRERTASETQLVRLELSPQETELATRDLAQRLRALRQVFVELEIAPARVVPDGWQASTEIAAWLTMLEPIRIAARANAD